MAVKKHLRLPVTADHRYRIEAGGCPIEVIFDVLGGRWKPILLFAFWEGAQRFSELRRRIPQIAPRILARQLRQLERDGLIARRVDPARPRARLYVLTPVAAPLGEALIPLRDWGARYIRRRLRTTARSPLHRISAHQPRRPEDVIS
ncbi:MAG: helix-turn-helix transcriptional regulator [Opitutaceae bacterium]|nr:helix-turn-helix transcriptional regulator [Opitutaceae bacterium]